MRRFIHSIRPRFWTGALFAVLALGWGARPAPASCGDYVTIVNEQSSSSTQPAPGPKKPTPCSQHSQDPSAPRRAPCPGPSCSGDPLPQSAPVTVTPNSGERDPLGLVGGAADLADAYAGALLANDGPIQLIRRAMSVFHPPRSI